MVSQLYDNSVDVKRLFCGWRRHGAGINAEARRTQSVLSVGGGLPPKAAISYLLSARQLRTEAANRTYNDAVRPPIGEWRSGEDHHEGRYSCLHGIDGRCELVKMRGSLVHFPLSELDFDRRPTSVRKRHDQIRLQSVLVPVVGDGAVHGLRIDTEIACAERFKKETRAGFHFRIWRCFTSVFGGVSLPHLAMFHFRIWRNLAAERRNLARRKAGPTSPGRALAKPVRESPWLTSPPHGSINHRPTRTRCAYACAHLSAREARGAGLGAYARPRNPAMRRIALRRLTLGPASSARHVSPEARPSRQP